jgi:hypothetical protein
MLGRCADLSVHGVQSENISTYTLDVYISTVYIIYIKQGDRTMETQGTAMVMEQLEIAQAAGKSIVMTKQIADVYIAGRIYTYNELINESMYWNIVLNTRCTLNNNKIVTRFCELSFMDAEEAKQYKGGTYELK